MHKQQQPAQLIAERRHSEGQIRQLRQQAQQTFLQLQRNERRFSQATDPYYVEQLIYERAALFSRCHALLRELRAPPELPPHSTAADS